MGFFDIFKSEEQIKREERIAKMQEQIFPGGKEQIDTETRKLREILDFKYSLEDTKSTFVHAAAIFNIAKDKSENRIVESILHNSQSVVTKKDAISIYNFLKSRVGIKGDLLNELNNMDDGEKFMLVVLGGITELSKHCEQLSNHGKFEAILFNASIVLVEYNVLYPDKYEAFQVSLLKGIIKNAQRLDALRFIDDIINFINDRFAFYLGQIDNILGSEPYIPGHVYYLFYEQPLDENHEFSNDVGEAVLFYPGLTKMIAWVQRGARAMVVE